MAHIRRAAARPLRKVARKRPAQEDFMRERDAWKREKSAGCKLFRTTSSRRSPSRGRARSPNVSAPRIGALRVRGRCSTRASAIACALRFSGIERGDRVALIADNRVDWIAANFGILLAGCVVVPIFATLAHDQMDFIFVDSGAKLAFVESTAMAERLRASCPHAPRMIAFDGEGPDSLKISRPAARAISRKVARFWERLPKASGRTSWRC